MLSIDRLNQFNKF